MTTTPTETVSSDFVRNPTIRRDRTDRRAYLLGLLAESPHTLGEFGRRDGGAIPGQERREVLADLMDEGLVEATFTRKGTRGPLSLTFRLKG